MRRDVVGAHLVHVAGVLPANLARRSVEDALGTVVLVALGVDDLGVEPIVVLRRQGHAQRLATHLGANQSRGALGPAALPGVLERVALGARGIKNRRDGPACVALGADLGALELPHLNNARRHVGRAVGIGDLHVHGIGAGSVKIQIHRGAGRGVARPGVSIGANPGKLIGKA